MGFERVTAIIQGTKSLTDFSGTHPNYDTDVFRPIFDELEKTERRSMISQFQNIETGSKRASQKTSTSHFV